jgi:cytochrome b561
MAEQLHYGTTAKVFHWLIVALLIVQYPLGWFMPHIHRGMKPGDAMTFHISFEITILALIILRFFWRITHPVAPESSLPAWQQLISEMVRWFLYALVFATTMTGWLFASQRGWSISPFFGARLPALAEGTTLATSIGEVARDHGVDVALDDRHPCDGRDGAHAHLSRSDHAADATGEADGCAYQEPKAGGRGHEACAGLRVS